MFSSETGGAIYLGFYRSNPPKIISAHFKSFRGAIEKKQNGPEPLGPIKHEANGTPWFET